MTTRTRRPTLFLLAVLTTLAATPAAAAPTDEAAAKAHFDRGLEFFQKQSFADAVREFEAAYAGTPKFFILRNLGLAYDAIGKPVEAVDALRRYLADGKAQVPKEKRAEAEELIKANERKIGRLTVTAREGATVRVDGVDVGKAPLTERRLAAGVHHVLVTMTGFEPREVDVTLGGEESKRVEVELRPLVEKSAQLVVTCPAPGVTVLVNGQPAGTTPLKGPLAVAPGKNVITWQRRGYRGAPQTVEAKETEQASVACSLAIENPLEDALAGTLEVSTNAGASVSVDGLPLPRSGKVPEGPHHVVVTLKGHETWEGDVEVLAKATRSLEVTLTARPTEGSGTRAVWQRRVGIGLAGVGVLVGGYWLLRRGSYADDFETKADASQAYDLRCNVPKPPGDCSTAQGDKLFADAESARKAEARHNVVGAVGAGLVVTGAALWFFAPSDKPTSASARPFLWTGRGTQMLGVEGRF